MKKRRWLSLDIETKGLNPAVDVATVACTYDGTSAAVYHLCRPAPEGCECGGTTTTAPRRCGACSGWHMANAEALFRELDAAEGLCGYNCVRFDIPFLQRRYGICNARVGRWMAKCMDVFLLAAEGFGIFAPLKRVLADNGFPPKTGSGRDAIALAEAGRWDELADYCCKDAELSHRLTTEPTRILVSSPHHGDGCELVWRDDLGCWGFRPAAAALRPPRAWRGSPTPPVRSLFE